MSVTYKINPLTGNIEYSRPIKKNETIKVYFYRYRNVDVRKMCDYPIATAEGNNKKEMSWIKGMSILRIELQKRRLFGLLKSKWEIVESL